MLLVAIICIAAGHVADLRARQQGTPTPNCGTTPTHPRAGGPTSCRSTAPTRHRRTRHPVPARHGDRQLRASAPGAGAQAQRSTAIPGYLVLTPFCTRPAAPCSWSAAFAPAPETRRACRSAGPAPDRTLTITVTGPGRPRAAPTRRHSLPDRPDRVDQPSEQASRLGTPVYDGYVRVARPASPALGGLHRHPGARPVQPGRGRGRAAAPRLRHPVVLVRAARPGGAGGHGSLGAAGPRRPTRQRAADSARGRQCRQR